jgi:hypothetical protein
MVTGKADSFDVLEGMSPVRAMANGRTPPETASGACAYRGSLGTREDRQLLVRERPREGDRYTRRPGARGGSPARLQETNQWETSEVPVSEHLAKRPGKVKR